jgi:hypothetical protein
MFQTKVVDKIKTYFLLNNCFFENRAVYEIMWESTVKPHRTQMIIWCTRIACWIPKANTHSQYVILIAFPLQQQLHERASMLRYTYIGCLVYNSG